MAPTKSMGEDLTPNADQRVRARKKTALILCTVLLVSIAAAIITIVMTRKVVISGNGGRISATTKITTTVQIRSTNVSTTLMTTSRLQSTSGLPSTSGLHSTTSVTTTTTVTIALANAIQWDISGNNVVGLYETVAGSNGSVSAAGTGTYQYPGAESPVKACDRNLTTKYLNFGICDDGISNGNGCGVRTGLHVPAMRNDSRVTGLQLCTGNDHPDRDPITATLEGSNQDSSLLLLGSSWALIYNGTAGLDVDPGRSSCASPVYFSNGNIYKYYRFLVVSIRANGNSVQYSEIVLFGAQ